MGEKPHRHRVGTREAGPDGGPSRGPANPRGGRRAKRVEPAEPSGPVVGPSPPAVPETEGDPCDAGVVAHPDRDRVPTSGEGQRAWEAHVDAALSGACTPGQALAEAGLLLVESRTAVPIVDPVEAGMVWDALKEALNQTNEALMGGEPPTLASASVVYRRLAGLMVFAIHPSCGDRLTRAGRVLHLYVVVPFFERHEVRRNRKGDPLTRIAITFEALAHLCEALGEQEGLGRAGVPPSRKEVHSLALLTGKAFREPAQQAMAHWLGAYLRERRGATWATDEILAAAITGKQSPAATRVRRRGPNAWASRHRGRRSKCWPTTAPTMPSSGPRSAAARPSRLVGRGRPARRSSRPGVGEPARRPAGATPSDARASRSRFSRSRFRGPRRGPRQPSLVVLERRTHHDRHDVPCGVGRGVRAQGGPLGPMLAPVARGPRGQGERGAELLPGQPALHLRTEGGAERRAEELRLDDGAEVVAERPRRRARLDPGLEVGDLVLTEAVMFAGAVRHPPLPEVRPRPPRRPPSRPPDPRDPPV